jgi:penicillin-binding protein 1A
MALAVVSLVVGSVGGAGAGWWYWDLVHHPGPELDRRHILGVIAEESPVYFRDGVTRLGVFFDDEHRELVAFDELPRAYVAAIVAAEDERFWTHPGLDVFGLARAMVSNVAAGQVVAGGSTLSQQTAKNLYYRPDRSLKAKLVEAMRTLQLEHRYPKEDILGFYVNQFHVAGNGRGAGIAARHLFDKEVSELTTVECAMLAGLVKAPAYYDPFTGDEAQRKRAVEKATDRTRYVLRRMVEVPAEQLAGPIPGPGEDASPFQARLAEVRRVQQEAAAALASEVKLEFKRGVFRFDSSSVLDEVARRLAEPPFADVLKAAGIDDPARAGLKVITTLDPVAQKAAVYGLWHHLTEVGILLEGRTAADLVRADERAPRLEAGERVEAFDFRTASVVGPVEVDKKLELDVDLGGMVCRVDRDGLVRVAVALHRAAKKSTSAKVAGAEVDSFIRGLPVGGVVWVSVRQVGERALCDLELRPEVQGATVVLERGEVRAMVGGNDNRNFNRSTALRQMGSTWKTLVLHAAMELGWRPTDELDNRRNVFPFSTTFYYPRPDHEPQPVVSLAWAGVTSENLASVWLMHHLVDRLDDAQLAEVAQAVDLAQRGGESPAAYALRMQQSGVLALPTRVEEAWFLQARREVLAALPRGGHAGDAAALASMLFGFGFDAERAKQTDAARLAALDAAWRPTWALRESCGAQYDVLAMGWARGEVASGAVVADLAVQREGDLVRVVCGATPEGYAAPTSGMFGDGGPLPMLAPEGEMLVRGRVHAATLDAVKSAMERRALERELAGEAAPGLYDPALLYWHQDFRVLLAMRYLERTARRYGVQVPIQLSLSMALGASDLTLEEATLLYQGMVTGKTWTFGGVAGGPSGTVEVGAPAASTLLIQEIQDVEGHVIYKAVPKASEATSPDIAAMTADVLRNVIERGTGRRAKGSVSVGGGALPLGGKTGTTNDFRNAAFVGYAPRVGQGLATAADGWTFGVYVGYDDNHPMVSGGVRMAGASGALPAWLLAVRGVAAAGLLGDGAAPSGGWALPTVPECERVAVRDGVGLAGSEDPAAPTVLTRPAPEVVVAVEASPDRPVRLAPRTTEADALLRNRQLHQSGGVWGGLGRKEVGVGQPP